MLFKKRVLEGIAKNEITLAIRRWQRPSVKTGGRLRTAVGELAILAVTVVTEDDLTEQDALHAGYCSRGDLLADLAEGREGTLYRISFRLEGPDPRALLRQQAEASEDEWREVERRLGRLDAAASAGPWTLRFLRLIAEQPEVAAGELARQIGVERMWFKLNVRKLKELGLTESLSPGYRLSPRGQACLEWLEKRLA